MSLTADRHPDQAPASALSSPLVRDVRDAEADRSGLTRLLQAGDLAEDSVLAAAVENSPWFAERLRRACEKAWNSGFQSGRSQFRQITENPHREDGGYPSLPFVP